ncbi:hypothetical protein [Clostridium pasteurianum]|uniref:Uncharacterized protein n=1 Tax=Clostridium pasteurianum BC1 TaxID=86416 RepID=R4K5L6_CLOPA|nr:hypothetical protein [Clostridium pasteurianum]AGK95829.1 hypothetical protein Clopa_0800 [Clostridium pasteurianum BC1]
MNRKRILYILSAVILLVIVALSLYFSTFVQPKIVFIPQINKISSEEYKTILNNRQVVAEKGIEKYRNIDLQIKITNPILLIRNVKIEEDRTNMLYEYIKNNNNIQILDDSNSRMGNDTQYNENINIYLKNTSQNDLKNIIGNFRVRVSWKNIWGSQNYKIFYLKDYLK